LGNFSVGGGKGWQNLRCNSCYLSFGLLNDASIS